MTTLKEYLAPVSPDTKIKVTSEPNAPRHIYKGMVKNLPRSRYNSILGDTVKEVTAGDGIINIEIRFGR